MATSRGHPGPFQGEVLGWERRGLSLADPGPHTCVQGPTLLVSSEGPRLRCPRGPVQEAVTHCPGEGASPSVPAQPALWSPQPQLTAGTDLDSASLRGRGRTHAQAPDLRLRQHPS